MAVGLILRPISQYEAGRGLDLKNKEIFSEHIRLFEINVCVFKAVMTTDIKDYTLNDYLEIFLVYQWTAPAPHLMKYLNNLKKTF